MKRILEAIGQSSIFRFMIIGCCSTAIDFAIYAALSARLPTAPSKCASMLASSVFSYFANKRFTFRDGGRAGAPQLARFYLVFALNLAANVGTNEALYRWTGRRVLAFACATAAGMAVNYMGQRWVVFRGAPGDGG